MKRGSSVILAGVAAGLLAACSPSTEPPAEPVTEMVTVEEPIVPIETPAEIAKSDAPTDYQAISGYGDGWYVSPGWPGEYPAGFVVLAPDVSVPARTRPNPSADRDVVCRLPQYANYQLWNDVRGEADKLEFFVATKTFPITMTEDATIEYFSDAGVRTLDLKAGDQLTYLRYLGEGFTIVSFNGEQYDINEAELSQISDIGQLQSVADEWARVTCMGGEQAWLLYQEVLDHADIVASPITGYGEAADIFPEDVDWVREQGEANAAAYEGLEPFETD